MDRNSSEHFLLYLDPNPAKKAKVAIDDHLTAVLRLAIFEAKTGVADFEDPENPTEKPVFVEGESWKTRHRTACGQVSTNVDYLLRNNMITNSLAPYYMRWYRSEIPERDMAMVERLFRFYESSPGFKLAQGLVDNQVFKDGEDPQMMTDENTVSFLDERMIPRSPSETEDPAPSPGPDFVIDKFQ